MSLTAIGITRVMLAETILRTGNLLGFFSACHLCRERRQRSCTPHVLSLSVQETAVLGHYTVNIWSVRLVCGIY